ncbi:MAG TPA: serine/threonine-protein kinase [Pyrinomonadaceae bacterium]|nr:serine/threonine-protein kinase [Pyrinomonadaceae bacterium]
MSNSLLLNSMVGEYRLIDFLGEGGMGEVYRGVHAKLGRVAAVKVLNPAARREHGFVERFFNEARIQESLHHPNIAAVYDFTEVQGQPCIIMEYVDGDTLCDRVRPYGPLPTEEALRIFSSLVDAIAYVHSHGVIHRDIKSNNVKIGTQGQVKLLDFGIAKGGASPALTQTGNVIGTIEYLSPEQLSTGHADERSDIWALGVLLYEMMTGRVPFQAPTIGALCAQISNAEYPPLRQLNPSAPADVANVVSRCLKKNAAERYQSASMLLSDVRRAADSLNAPIPQPKPARKRAARAPADPYAPPPTSSVKSGPTLGRGWLMAGGVAAVLFCLFVLGGVGLWYALSGPAAENVNASALKSKTGKTVKVEMSDGPAEIWQGDKMIGVGRADVTAEVGDWVELKLKRNGKERVERFQMTENRKTWTLTFNK